jgi:hypothetical protein
MGGRLARAVDARDHDHAGLVRAGIESALQRLQALLHRCPERCLERSAILDARGLGAPAQVFDERAACLDAAIGLQQRGFELLEQRLVDAAAAEQIADIGH